MKCPCENCLVLPICISKQSCSCRLLDKHMRKFLDCLFPYNPLSLIDFYDEIGKIKRILHKSISTKRGREFNFRNVKARPYYDTMY